MKTLLKHTWYALAACLLLVACTDEAGDTTDGVLDDTTMTADTTAQMMPAMAMATLAPTEGNETAGTVTFTQIDNGILVEANVTNLSEGEHGFHVHENGDCSAPDASSAGDHFAPHEDPHGAPSDAPGQRHVGDFGNIEANAEGLAEYSRVDTVIAFEGTNSIIGKSVIVHQNPDDLTSQPSGESGPRLACGVIEMHNQM